MIKGSKCLRRAILKTSYLAKACHIGSALSCVDVLRVILKKKRRKDYFIFSKASGVAALYILTTNNPVEFLKKYPLPDKRAPGVMHSLGSLGHGLPVAAGLALANKERDVYCLMSDGELQEGTTWESLLFASHHCLDNLIIIVDRNRLQACGETEKILKLEPLVDKLKAFGVAVTEVDGHDRKELKRMARSIPLKKNKPTVVIAKTIKGKGVDFMEDAVGWHYYNLTLETGANAILQNPLGNSGKRQEGNFTRR